MTTTSSGAHKGDVVTIFGSTGTGKTKLSVELALAISSDPVRFGGYAGAEVISCDSMQIYKGLDIITNKATEEEMRGVRHHLLGFLDPAENAGAGESESEGEIGSSYDVTKFVDDTNRIAAELLGSTEEKGKGKGKVPIVCGGTTYYLQHLLFPGRLITTTTTTTPEGRSTEAKEADLSSDPRFQQLSEDQKHLLGQVSTGNTAKVDLASKAAADPTLAMQLWKLLQALDPTMASRWHYKDSRKVANSLRVYKETGRPHSVWIAEQDSSSSNQQQIVSEAREQEKGVSGYRKLLFWLWCDPPVLRNRLDDRVDEMVQRGLEAEVREMRAIAKSMLDNVLLDSKATATAKMQPNYQSGIFQTIGYRQFAEYLDKLEALSTTTHPTATATAITDFCSASSAAAAGISDKEKDALFRKAVEDTKTSTRQYAKSQLKWVQNKLIPEVRRAQQLLLSNNNASGSNIDVELYLLDASDVSKWEQNVYRPAVTILESFLNRQPLPDPSTVSNAQATREYLLAGRSTNQALSKFSSSTSDSLVEAQGQGRGEGLQTIEANKMYICDTCTFDPNHPVLVRHVDSQQHRKGRHHRNNLKRKMDSDEKARRIQDKIQQGEKVRAQRASLKAALPPTAAADARSEVDEKNKEKNKEKDE